MSLENEMEKKALLFRSHFQSSLIIQAVPMSCEIRQGPAKGAVLIPLDLGVKSQNGAIYGMLYK